MTAWRAFLTDLQGQHESLKKNHENLKHLRECAATEAPTHLAAIAYLKSLEAELQQVAKLLSEAWVRIDSSKDFRKCVYHMDRAQSRMHKVIKRLGK